MSEAANHHESGNGAADATGPKLGRAEVLPYRPPSRRRSGLRSWARQNFSRKQLLTSLKTMLWVAPLTVLIWIYAEREQQFTPPPVTIPIEIVTNDPNRLVTLLRPIPKEPWVTASITGPRSGVEAVMHSWDPASGGHPIRIEIDRQLATGDNVIPASVIGNDPRFASHGVSVSSPSPVGIDVVIDQIVEMPVDVKAVNVPSNVASVTFTPPTIKVRGPKRILDEASGAGTLHAEADLAHQAALADANPSDHSIPLRDLPLILSIKSSDVTIVGALLVQAQAELKTGKELTLGTVTVEVATTEYMMDHYRIDYDPTLRDVTVVGPEDKIALLSPSNPGRATFEVTQSDISSMATTSGGKTVAVEWKFPPGVEYKSGPKEINFKLIERHSTE